MWPDPVPRVTFEWSEEEFCCPNEKEMLKAHRRRQSPSSEKQRFADRQAFASGHIVSQWSAGSRNSFYAFSHDGNLFPEKHGSFKFDERPKSKIRYAVVVLQSANT